MTLVRDLDHSVVGHRIQVERVAIGEAERLGYVDDSLRLARKMGRAKQLHQPGRDDAQLDVEWDGGFTTLMLCGRDSVKVID